MNYMGSHTNHMHNLTELVWQALETQVNLSLSLSLSHSCFSLKMYMIHISQTMGALMMWAFLNGSQNLSSILSPTFT